MKRLILLLLAVILGLCGGAFFNLSVSPDNQWLLNLDRLKSAALKKSAGKKRILVVGGSSVLFGIDAGLLSRETGRASVNLGLSAGMGGLFLLGYAEEATLPGDLVVLSMEPDLFSNPPAPVRESSVFATRIGRRGLIYGGKENPVASSFSEELDSWLNVTTPGIRRMTNYTARRIMHLPLFRYGGKQVDENGFAVEKVTLPHTVGRDYAVFDPGWTPILRKYRERLEKRGVRVVYRPSWCEVAPERLAEIRVQALQFQAKIAEVIPVATEEDLGLKTDPSLFSDFLMHLSVKGSEESTKSLAQLISQWL